ncbi:MAG: alpha/beta fold hydrolase [Acidobacteria bacterium]|nr:alpha/beta fold hydrolase [Acidobacteriota bacterium]
MPLLIAIVAVPTAYWTLIWAVQRNLLFPAPPASVGRRAPHDSVRVELSTPAGPMEAWFLPADGDPTVPGPAILFAHGNGEIIDYLPDTFDGARSAGFGVLLIEYPGYGRNPGRPTEASVRRVMTEGFDWLATQPEVDPERIIAYGRSLGGGAVGALLTQRRPAAVILQSTFRSIRHMARRLLVPGFLVRDPFDTIHSLTQHAGPLLLIHGDRDDVVPIGESEALHAAFPDSEYVVLPCGHNDCPTSWPEHWEMVLGFLARHGVQAQADVR